MDKETVKEKSTVDDYNYFFNSEVGRRVLANMLIEAKFFDVSTTPEEQAVENFMKITLGKTGCFPIEHQSDISKMEMYVGKLMELPKEY